MNATRNAQVLQIPSELPDAHDPSERVLRAVAPQGESSSVSQNATSAAVTTIPAVDDGPRAIGRGAASRWFGRLCQQRAAHDPLAAQALEAAHHTSSDYLPQALEQLLRRCEEVLANEIRTLAPQEAAIASDSDDLVAQYQHEIAAFLVEAQPGALTETARLVLREHRHLIDKLHYTLHDLNSEVLRELASR